MIKEIEQNGCYFGHLSEINPLLLEKLETLTPILNREYYTRVTHSYFGIDPNKIESTFTSTFDEAEIVKKQWISDKDNKKVWQVFYTFNNDNDEGCNVLQKMIPQIRELFLSIVEYCYGKEMLDKIWDINRNVINLTNFTEGCFIDDHSDGGSPNMVCNILIYLNKDWQKEMGGELVIKNEFNQEPKWGNFAVLDFIKHNPSHLVTPILTSNTNRFAVLTGVLLKENEFISKV